VMFTGFVPLETLLAGYSAADAFFLPTRAESYGNVVLEAAAYGLPVILRNIPAFDDWLNDKVDCMKGENAKDFARAVESIRSDDNVRATLRSGSEKLAEHHDIVNTARKLYEIYSALLEGAR